VFSVGCLVSRQCHTISTLVRICRFLCVGFQDVNTVAVCSYTFYEAVIASGWCNTPLAYKILCVRFTCVVHDGSRIPPEASLSATGTTLDTGGGLTLTRPGLSPGKKRQASLGALTTWFDRYGETQWRQVVQDDPIGFSARQCPQ
jgi:hypothetical protein